MKPKLIITLMVMLYNISDVVASDHNRLLRRLPEDRRRMALFPKITKKFVITPLPEEKREYTNSIPRPQDLKKKRVMPKIIPHDKKGTVIIPVYKPPVTRRPLMKITKFTLLPYPVQSRRNEELSINRINKKNLGNYDTFESYENESKESMLMEDDMKSGEEYGQEAESIENEDYDNDMTENYKNIESQEENHSNAEQSQAGSHQYAEEDNYGMNSSKSFSNEEIKGIIVTNPSEKYERGEVVSNGSMLNDSESMENEQDETNSKNVSDEIFDVNFLEEIETSTDDTIIFNEESDFTTETQFSEEKTEDTLGIIELQHDQTTFATLKTSVTEPMEKRLEEFMELYNIKTSDPVVDKIRTRFKRNKRTVNIIEEENLGTTISGFKFTGREPLLNSDLTFKNINT